MKNSSHRLAAIVFADIVGYTTLMQNGENKAMELVNRFESLTEEYVKKYDGQVVKKYGDGCLILFNSTVNAVKCAKDLQIRFREKPHVPLRIGIHVGEVIQKENDVFGHGVNIASRVESMAIPGAVLLSKSAYEKVQNQEVFNLESLGSYKFQNVTDQIEVFALTNEGLAIPDRNNLKGKIQKSENVTKNKVFIYGGIALTLLLGFFILNKIFLNDKINTQPSSVKSAISKNSIAVLPFDNMSNGEENRYFADGMHDDLLTYLSKLKNLKVISRTSVTSLKNTTMTIPEIGSLLGVAHIMEGSVRRINDQVRINVQLIEAESDNNIWSEIYDLELTTEKIFETQSEIAAEISTQLTQSIFSKESDNDYASYTNNLLAYENYLRAKQLKDTGNPESLQEAKILLEQALELDDQFAEAITLLANLHIHLVYYAGEDAAVFFPKSWELMEKSLEVKPNLSETHALKGSLNHWWKRNIEGAREAYERAIQLNPNNADALYGLAIAIQDLDLNFSEVLELLNKALAINPLNPNLINTNGIYHRENDRPHEAINVFKKGIRVEPSQPNFWENYSDTYYYLGRADSAAIIAHQSIEENEKSGSYLRQYLKTISNLSLLDELEKEVIIDLSDSDQDKATKLDFKRDLHVQRREFDKANSTLNELRQYSYRGLNIDLNKFENTYFKRDFYTAVNIYEEYYTDVDFEKEMLNFSTSEQNFALNYLYSLYQIGEKEKANTYNQLFKDLIVKSNNKQERIQTRRFRMYLKSLHLQINGKSSAAIELLDSFLSNGNTYNSRFIELDPIFDSIRDSDGFNMMMDKYRKIMREQQTYYQDYLKENY